MGPEPHQKFFLKNISKNVVARGVGSFCTLGGTTDTQIELCPNSFGQFIADT